VDGQPRFRRERITVKDMGIKIAVDLNDQSRFLSLVATDGGDTNNWDEVIFGDPRLVLVEDSTVEEKQGENTSRKATRNSMVLGLLAGRASHFCQRKPQSAKGPRSSVMTRKILCAVCVLTAILLFATAASQADTMTVGSDSFVVRRVQCYGSTLGPWTPALLPRIPLP